MMSFTISVNRMRIMKHAEKHGNTTYKKKRNYCSCPKWQEEVFLLPHLCSVLRHLVKILHGESKELAGNPDQV